MKAQITVLAMALASCFLSACSNNTDSANLANGNTLPTTGLTVFQNANQAAPSTYLQTGVIYKGSGATGSGFQSLPTGYDNSIRSFKLPKGYMVTFAENIDGTGESITYVAATSALSQNLPTRLVNNISFVRYIPIASITKKGTANTDINVVNVLKSDWYYKWDDSLKNTSYQFVPMTWGKTTATTGIANYFIGLSGIDHILSFNEPDNVGQSNIPIDTAVNHYKVMLGTGLRLGAPAVQQGHAFGAGNWLTLFMAGAAAQKDRVDFIPLHWYDWGNETETQATDSLTAVAILGRFKTYVANVHSSYPSQMIWITEFNANDTRANSKVHEIFMRNATAWLNTQSYIERYSYFFPGILPPTTGAPNYTLTPIGSAWKNIVSTPAFAANIIPN